MMRIPNDRRWYPILIEGSMYLIYYQEIINKDISIKFDTIINEYAKRIKQIKKETKKNETKIKNIVATGTTNLRWEL